MLYVIIILVANPTHRRLVFTELLLKIFTFGINRDYLFYKIIEYSQHDQ